MKIKLPEKIRWWLYHPKFELIYLLGGIPHEHINTLNYRNIDTVVKSLRSNIDNAIKNKGEEMINFILNEPKI